MLGGVVGARGFARCSRSRARRRSSSRACATRGELRLGRGELAIVPLSLAGSLPVSSLAVPPLTARALGVRASSRQEAARTFLDFLAGEQGNAAFRACGRSAAR